MSYQLAKLVLISYQPPRLEVGMMFAMNVSLRTFTINTEYLHVHLLTELSDNEEEYISQNGFPVRLFIIAQEQSNPDSTERILASPEQIACMRDEDEYEQDYTYDIIIDDINRILMNNGLIEILMDDNQPVLLDDGRQEKVLIREYVEIVDELEF